jgi:hypothetical protein
MIDKKDMEEALLEAYGPEYKQKKGYSVGLDLPWEVYNLLADGDVYALREMALAMKQCPKEFGGIA